MQKKQFLRNQRRDITVVKDAEIRLKTSLSVHMLVSDLNRNVFFREC